MSVKSLTTAFATSLVASGILSTTALANEAPNTQDSQHVSLQDSDLRPVLNFAGLGAAHDFYSTNENGEYVTNTLQLTLYPGVVGAQQPNGQVEIDVVPAFNFSLEREWGDDEGYKLLSANVNFISEYEVWQAGLSFDIGENDVETPHVMTALGFGDTIQVVRGISGTYNENVTAELYISAASYEDDNTTKAKLTLGYNDAAFARLDYSKEWYGVMGVDRLSVLAGGFGYVEDDGGADAGIYSTASFDLGGAKKPDAYQFFIGYANSAETPETFTTGVSIALKDGGSRAHELDIASSARKSNSRIDLGVQQINGTKQIFAGLRQSF